MPYDPWTLAGSLGAGSLLDVPSLSATDTASSTLVIASTIASALSFQKRWTHASEGSAFGAGAVPPSDGAGAGGTSIGGVATGPPPGDGAGAGEGVGAEDAPPEVGAELPLAPVAPELEPAPEGPVAPELGAVLPEGPVAPELGAVLPEGPVAPELGAVLPEGPVAPELAPVLPVGALGAPDEAPGVGAGLGFVLAMMVLLLHAGAPLTSVRTMRQGARTPPSRSAPAHDAPRALAARFSSTTTSRFRCGRRSPNPKPVGRASVTYKSAVSTRRPVRS